MQKFLLLAFHCILFTVVLLLGGEVCTLALVWLDGFQKSFKCILVSETIRCTVTWLRSGAFCGRIERLSSCLYLAYVLLDRSKCVHISIPRSMLSLSQRCGNCHILTVSLFRSSCSNTSGCSLLKEKIFSCCLP